MRNFKIILLVLVGLAFFNLNYSQQQEEKFKVELEEVNIPGMPGLQSFSWGKSSDGKWLLVGGRTDGLHLRRPFESFLATGNNNKIYVVDIDSMKVWSITPSGLSQILYDQLQSTNQLFIQRDSFLYIFGGYGYSVVNQDWITYPYLIAINIDSLVAAVINGQTNVAQYFRHIQNNNFAITGGQAGYMDSVFYLCGGQKFTGRYNPMNGPSFTQQYTEEVRKFKILDDGTNITITDYQAVNDPTAFHRRDYNMSPQIFPDGRKGFTMFTGVFQVNADLPFLNSVNVFDTTYFVENTFDIYLSHYHSAKIPVYDSTNNVMHTVFFGGIAQYYIDSTGTMQRNDSVPFVNTISMVTRYSDWSMAERKIGEMPSLLGSGAEVIPVEDTSGLFFGDEIVNVNSIPLGQRRLVGYMVGGIESSAPNIFWINDGTQSWASTKVFKIYISKDTTSSIKYQQLTGDKIYNLKLYPNPASNKITMNFFLPNIDKHNITIRDLQGRTVKQISFNDKIGEKTMNINISDLAEGTYLLELGDKSYKTVAKFVKNR